MDKKKRKQIYIILCFITILLIFLLFLVPGRKEQLFFSVETTPGETSSADSAQYPESESGKPVTASEKERQSTTAGGKFNKKKREKQAEQSSLYIIIDDVGYNLDQLEQFLELPFPVAFSVLPGLPYTEQAATRITEHKKDVMIHIPMEPLNGEDPGPGAVYTSMADEQIVKQIESFVEELPSAVAANNHMGSAATADERVMHVVLNTLRKKDIVFIDSLTTAESVVAKLSEKLDVPYMRRNVFLDNKEDDESIIAALQEGVGIARKEGKAVLIGHVWSEELPKVLAESYETIDTMGVTVKSIRELVKKK